MGTLILLGAMVAGCSSYFDMPLDASAAHVEPWVGHHGAVLETTVPEGSRPMGVEGSVLFFRLLNEHGRTVMDTFFQWPRDAKEIPAGHFSLVGYWRGCNGNCGNLSAPSAPFCRGELDVAPGDVISVLVFPSSLAPGPSCRITAASS